MKRKQMRVRRSFVATLTMIALMIVATVTAAVVEPGGFDLSQSTVDAGGGTSSGGGFVVNGTIGQPDAGGPMSGGTFALIGGYWPGAGGPTPFPCPADVAPPGGDSMVNVTDLLAVINSWGNCTIPCPPTCAADTNQDCAVNVTDLLAVINAWGSCPTAIVLCPAEPSPHHLAVDLLMFNNWG